MRKKAVRADMELPFDPKASRFIALMVHSDKNLFRAALALHMSMDEAKRCWKRKDVREEVERRCEIVYAEQARLAANARNVDVVFVDDNLATAVQAGAKKGDTRALELAYDRLGLRRNGEFLADPGESSSQPEIPLIYRAMERTVTNTITQTQTQQVSERQVDAEAPVAPKPQAPAIEILQY